MASKPSPEHVAALLDAWNQGDAGALDQLIELLYRELRRLAHAQMRRERSAHTLQTTGLINELYMRLAAQRSPNWQTRAQFFGISAHLMRRILVDYARAKHYGKRGGGTPPIALEEAVVFTRACVTDLLPLHEALERLAIVDARKARVVELRYFGGLSVEETADVLDVSPVTVLRDWQMAKAWLRRELSA